MSIRPQAPAPFLSEEVAERLLALPTPPPSLSTPYCITTSSDTLPAITYTTTTTHYPYFMLRISGSRAAGLDRESTNTPGRPCRRPSRDAPTTLEGVNQRVIELSSTVDQEDEINILSWMSTTTAVLSGGGGQMYHVPLGTVDGFVRSTHLRQITSDYGHDSAVRDPLRFTGTDQMNRRDFRAAESRTIGD
ncbi:hypothetical protein Tco_0236915 [Tanacetum coccineum]